jgi:CRISPR-associated protein Csm2
MYKQNQFKPEWITDSDSWLLDGDSPIEWAKNFGRFLANDADALKGDKTDLCDFKCQQKALSTSQLRKFFGQLKRIQVEGFDKSRIKLQMLIPQLAYASGRDIKEKRQQTKIDFFYKEISGAIKLIKTQAHFQNFINLTEAIVAYHKAEGGK